MNKLTDKRIKEIAKSILDPFKRPNLDYNTAFARAIEAEMSKPESEEDFEGRLLAWFTGMVMNDKAHVLHPMDFAKAAFKAGAQR